MLAIFVFAVTAAPTQLVIFQTDQVDSKLIRLQSDGTSKVLLEMKEPDTMSRNWLGIVVSPDRKQVGWCRYVSGPKQVGDSLQVSALSFLKGKVQTQSFSLGNNLEASFGFNERNQVAVVMGRIIEWSLVDSSKAVKLASEPGDAYRVSPHWNSAMWQKGYDETSYPEVIDNKLGVKVEWRDSGWCYARWSDGKEGRLKSPGGWFYSFAPSTYPYVYASVEDRKYVGHSLFKPYIYQIDVRDGTAIRLIEGASVVVVSPGSPFARATTD